MHEHTYIKVTRAEACACMNAGLLLPILGALPDALIIVVSGLGGTREEAEEQVTLKRHPAGQGPSVEVPVPLPPPVTD